jgi:hypothetical protein
MDSDRLKLVQEWLSQKDKHKLRSFLGLGIYYWRFTAVFADIAKLLTQFREEKQTSQWYPEAEVAF